MVYLAAAFVVVWLVVGLYVVYIGRRQSRIAVELENLAEAQQSQR